MGRIAPIKPEEPAVLSAVVDFEDVPHSLLATSNTSSIKYNPSYKDANLWKLLTPFRAKDILRPQMMGLNFDSFGIVATDGHRLALLPHKKLSEMGLFADQAGEKVDGRFPDYENAIPVGQAFKKTYPVSVRAIRSYLQAALLFVNETAKNVPFRVQGEEYIGFNGQLLQETMLFFEQLGYDTIYAHFIAHDRAVVFSVERYFSLHDITKPAVLIMPSLMLADSEGKYGVFPYDYDYQRGLRAVWNFEKNTVQSIPDGKLYRYEANGNMWNHPLTVSDLLPPQVFTVLSKLLLKKANVPIIELVKKDADTLTATRDLGLWYEHKNPLLNKLPNGIYRLVKNKALLPDTDNPIDFPRVPKTFNAEGQQDKISVRLPKNVFEEAVEFVGTDELRPYMTGVYLNVGQQEKVLRIAATNGHLLYTQDVAVTATAEREISGICPAVAGKIHGLLGDGELTFNSQVGTINYGQDRLIIRMIDERFPDYQSAIPQKFTQQYHYQPSEFAKALSAIKVVAKDKYITWKVAKKGGDWFALKIENRYDDRPPKEWKLLDTVPLKVSGTVENKVFKPGANGLVVMPVYANYFLAEYDVSFDLELLKKAISNYQPSTKMILGSYEQNRATILVSDSASQIPKPQDDMVKLRAEALVFIQRQRLRLGSLAGIEPNGQITLFGLGSVEELDDSDYLTTYNRVRHLVDETTRKAHDYYSLETDRFSDLSNLYDDTDIATDWQAHKRRVQAVMAQISKANSINDGYTQGRAFVGRNQKQTAGMDVAELAKLIREELAAEFPDSKFSVKVDRFSGGQSIDVKVMSVPFDPFSPEYIEYLKDTQKVGDWLSWLTKKRGYDSYHRQESTWNEKFQKVLDKATQILNQYNYDNSDPMTDYFHVRYYGHVSVDSSKLVQQYYPDTVEGQYYANSAKKEAEWKAAQSKKTSAGKGKFKKWSVVYYTHNTGRPARKGYLSDGKYLAAVLKSPNGQATFSYYDIVLLRPISELSDLEANRIRSMDERYRSHYLFVHNGSEYVRDPRWRTLENVTESKLSSTEQADFSDEEAKLKAQALVLIQRQRLRLL